MVCLGNICRSPLAEGILKNKIEKACLDWEVDSAGTGDYHIGQHPHYLAQKTAKMYAIDISCQKARQFQKEDMLRFDRIYVMDNENYEDVKRMSKELWNKEKVDLLLNELFPGENSDVPDPWFGTEKGFHEVFAMIDKACERIIASRVGEAFISSKNISVNFKKSL